ncbi:hypothetical protein D9619_009832 [Psilocybe cf. subviscida]|uniref:Uncharacterized protein n=1 Tax=Psilocybe cf. subviscida TaxID=2480587 RepID=A0A8H5F5X0_9AGAR|nr:hypothetical protein D9619_009832 [Psilocybe cf. subviscida]
MDQLVQNLGENVMDRKVASPSNSSPLCQPHIRTGSASSSTSTSTTTSIRPSPALPTTATTTASATSSSTTATSSGSATPRVNRPSPLSQGNYTVAEKRRSRDDSDIDTEVAAELAAAKEEEEDDDVSIKASQVNGKLKSTVSIPAKSSAASGTEDEGPMSASTSTSAMPPKKKGRAASLFNSRLNASTDNISLSSTVSSASVMIRKLSAMGKLVRRNALAGITSLFKDKDKDKSKNGEEGSKKKKDKKAPATAKGQAIVASVSHVTAELDRPGATGDWSVGTDMNGLSPAAKLARQHTLKSNAEAAAKAKEAREAKEAKDAKEAKEAALAAANAQQTNGAGSNGTQVPAWDRNTATRHGLPSPAKGGMRINEDGTRTLIEEDDDESDDGHYAGPSGGQYGHGHHEVSDGWDDDEDWDFEGDQVHDEDEDEEATIRLPVDDGRRESGDSYGPRQSVEMEPWAVDVRRSVERTRQPTKGILKRRGSIKRAAQASGPVTLVLAAGDVRDVTTTGLWICAETYDQQQYRHEQSNPLQRVRANSDIAAGHTEAGPLARIPSRDPDHIDGLHRHPSHSSGHGPSSSTSSLPSSSDPSPPFLPPLSLDANISRFSGAFSTVSIANALKEILESPTSLPSAAATGGANASGAHAENRTSAIFQHPIFNSSAPALSTMGSVAPPTLTHRSATSPSKRLTFATNLSVYDTFSASVYDRRSKPATWSRLTPALAQRIKEELNSYKMEEMEIHASSRIHTQFFV